MTTRPAALEIIIPLTRRMLLKNGNSPFTKMKVFSSRAQGIARTTQGQRSSMAFGQTHGS
jgi:hypothetical protein